MSMRSAVILAPERAEVIELRRPVPGEDEVLVELEGCGICGSDVPVWEGRPWFTYPRDPGAPGHEGWGRIVARGSGVQEVRLGSRVAALSFHSHAQFDVACADQVVELPEALAGLPFPGEPFACAVNIAARAALVPGKTVAVVGAGFIGSLLVRLASLAGACTIAIARRPFQRELALELGADHALAPDGAVEAVEELTGGELCDVVIEATGAQQPLELCARLARVRGRLVIAGYHQDGTRTVDMQLWNWRGLDVINAHERDPAIYLRGLRTAVALVAAGRLDPRPLMTHEFPLADVQDAFVAAAERPAGFVKATVRP